MDTNTTTHPQYRDRLFKAIFGRDTEQSTYNPNMPLRGLMYFSQLYQMYLSENEKDVHRPKLIKIPNPKFIVFYNGEKQCPDRTLLRLSDSFEIPDKSGFFEWTAEMININRGHNETLQKICEPLYNYRRRKSWL